MPAEVERLGWTVDLLVDAAGVGSAGPSHEPRGAGPVAALDVDARALWALTAAVLPGMPARGHAGVLAVASTAGQVPMPSSVVYGATTAYVPSPIRALRAETRGTGVHVAGIVPGATRPTLGGPGRGEVRGPLAAAAVAEPDEVAGAALGANDPARVHGRRDALLSAGLGLLPAGARARVIAAFEAGEDLTHDQCRRSPVGACLGARRPSRPPAHRGDDAMTISDSDPGGLRRTHPAARPLAGGGVATSRRVAAGLLGGQFVCMWGAFFVLAPAIDWPASLDLPASEMLPLLLEESGAIFLGYGLYLVHALLLVPAAVALFSALGGGAVGRGAMALGILAGAAKALGIVRWLFLMPVLAAAWVAPEASEATRAAISAVFDAFNAYAGGVGELLGVGLFAGLWTVALSALLLRHGARWLGVSGLGAAALLFSTLLSLVGIESPLLLTGSGILWQVWTAALAVWLWRAGTREDRA